jgi:hypothetical protein
MKFAFLLSLFFLTFQLSSVHAEAPNCEQIDGYPTSVAFVHLKNAGITDNYKLDFSKTKVVRLASEKIGEHPHYREDLYRQVHLITFQEKDGNTLKVITVHDATNTECSMSGVKVFVVSVLPPVKKFAKIGGEKVGQPGGQK